MNLQRFDLLTLRLFVAAVDTGSLTAGAERVDLSLAAASKRMAELESHLGAPLLERGPRGVAPTEAGLALLPHAVDLVARLEQMALVMGDVRSGTAGRLRLWANTSAFGGFLPGLLADYARRYPRVVLDLEDVISEDAVRGVARGAAELAVIGDNTPAEGLQTMVAHVDELVLMLPQGHALLNQSAGGGASNASPHAEAVALGDLLNHDLVAFARPTSLTRQLSTAAEALRRPLRIRAQVRSFDAMARMVAAGLGLAVLPREAARPYAAALGLVLAPLAGLRTERRLLLAWRERAQLTGPAEAMVRMVEGAGRAERN